ncbi:hypothetical protein CRG98_022904 [Punica granatum]|uniref:Secreted protein n=1 Tax=Punica granatum TaxID=22663 RepID=A0A2I0JK93_PUNGR|nr:hypothetical protein CRG98_022904 [Punica granatum]
MAISAPRRLLGKLISVLLFVLPNCECPLEFLGQCGMNFVCRNSIRPVSGYALLKKVVAWIIADIVVWNGGKWLGSGRERSPWPRLSHRTHGLVSRERLVSSLGLPGVRVVSLLQERVDSHDFFTD